MKAHCLTTLFAVLMANSALQAQITTQVTLNFSGTANGINTGNSHYATFTGAGNITPFGAATFVGYVVSPTVPAFFTFYLASGGSFQIDNPETVFGSGSFGCCGFIGIVSNRNEITGGTGAFQNASGSLKIGPPSGNVEVICTPSSDNPPPMCPAGFQFTGSGSITTAGTVFVSPAALPFSFLAGNSAPSSQSLTITNGTSQSAAFSATTSGESWLSVSLPDSGTVAAFSSATATVTVNPSGLTPGTYSATVTLAASGQQFVVPVTVTVSSAQLGIAISQTALRFQVAAGAGAPPSQSITVLNQGTGPLNWSAKASALFGSWLSVAPSAGSGGDAATVSVDPTNLAPGDYYGLVKFTAAGASNSPQPVVVVLNVLPATSAVPTVEPTGLIFVGEQGGANPAAQTVTVSNPSNQSITVTPTALAQQNGIFSTAPSVLQTVTSAQPAEFLVSADLTGLMAGVYPGSIQFLFGDGSVQQVAVVLIVTPPGRRACGTARTSRRSIRLHSHPTDSRLHRIGTKLYRARGVAHSADHSSGG